MPKEKEYVVIDDGLSAAEEAEMIELARAGTASADGLVSLEAPAIDPYVDNSAGHVGRYKAPPVPAKKPQPTQEEYFQREMLIQDKDGSRKAAEAAVVKTRQLGNSGLSADELEDLHRAKDSVVRKMAELDNSFNTYQQAYWEAETRLSELCGQRQEMMELRNDISRRIIASERGKKAGVFPLAGK